MTDCYCFPPHNYTCYNCYEAETNRQKRQKRKKGIYWCDHCDAALVGDWEKCPTCGKRSGVRRIKEGKRKGGKLPVEIASLKKAILLKLLR